jgi:hypothetical protein
MWLFLIFLISKNGERSLKVSLFFVLFNFLTKIHQVAKIFQKKHSSRLSSCTCFILFYVHPLVKFQWSFSGLQNHSFLQVFKLFEGEDV